VTLLTLPPFDVAADPDERPASYDYTVDLNGTEYRIKLFYRERQDRWYLDLLDADDVPILMGRILVIERPLLAQYVSDSSPAGELVLVDTAASDVECGFEDLGARCFLMFGTPDEFSEDEEPELDFDPGIGDPEEA
jgi:hypothetical protein